MDVQQMPLRWPLVGRENELEEFTGAWAKRSCQGLVISGPAGVGKSRLAEECLARAVQAGFEGGRATASAVAATVPLGAIAHLIPAGVDLSDPVKGFAEVARALAGPSRARRWAVLVDDLHLLDSASAVLLRQLLDEGVVRLISTVRTGGPVGEAVETLCHGDAVHRIDLSPFGPKQLEAVMQAALGAVVGRRTLHELHTASGGIALYLRELVLGALAAGTLVSDGEIWELDKGWLVSTPRLATLIGARLAAADTRARQVLDLLALCEPVSLTDAQRLASADVLAGLEETGLVQVMADRRRTTMQLAHPLYGEVLRAGIPTVRRRDLLLQQVEQLQSHGGRRRDDALHIATWQLAATGTADPDMLVQAATLARYARDYPHVVTLLQALPNEHHTTESRVLLGESHFELGDFAKAEDAFAQAEALAADEGQRLAVVMERTQSLFWSAARTEEALAVNTAALAEARDPMVRKILAVNESCMRIWNDSPTRGLEVLRDIEDMPDPRVRLFGLALKSAALLAVGRATEAAELSEQAYVQHRTAADKVVIQTAAFQLVYAAYAWCGAGRLDRAQQAADRAYTAAVHEHAPLPQAWAAFALAQSTWLAGRSADARRWFAEALARGRNHRLPLGLRLAASGLAAACAVSGDIDAAEATLAEIDNYPPHTGYWEGHERLGEAWLLAARGQLTQARTVLSEAARSARARGHVSAEGTLLTDVARLGGARDVADRLAELAEVCDGGFAPARAHLAAALAADDPDRLLAAAGELEQIGAVLLAAEAATVAAAAWRRTGQARRAAAAAQQAQAYAARCQGSRTPLLTTTEATAALTAREREVVLLAAVGTSSRDIATALHLSVRTIDNHLQHAYVKLGVTTRRELADALGTNSNPPPSRATELDH